jgi:tetratricopeptide (TPR) repeat protein
VWRSETISADHGGIAAGRDAIVGLQPDQLPAIIEAATSHWKQLTDDQRGTISSLEKRLGVSEGVLQAFFRTLGESNVPLEHQGSRLIEIAEDYKRVRAQVSAAAGDPPEIAKLKGEARSALDLGEFAQADSLLEQVLAAEDAAIDQRKLESALTSGQRGDIALTRLRYREAAQHFAAAAVRVPPKYEEEALAYLDCEAEALGRQGDEFGDSSALDDAVNRYKVLLNLRIRERAPLHWAMTQNNLGNVLRHLGERESGTARLEEAVVAYREALKEYTRKRVPLQWAATQNNLGNALASLGERESRTARLEEAVAAYREALSIFEAAGASYYASIVKSSLERAQTLLTERGGL